MNIERSNAGAAITGGHFSQTKARTVWLMCAVVAFACHRQSAAEPTPAEATPAPPRNEDISWEGTFFGLFPKFSKRLQPFLGLDKREAASKLVPMLDDPKRFVAAHVLLSVYFNRPLQSEDSSRYYHRLRVTLHGDGTVTYYPGQRAQLKAYWKQLISETLSKETTKSP